MFLLHPAGWEQRIRVIQAQEKISKIKPDVQLERVTVPWLLEVEVEPGLRLNDQYLTARDKATYLLNSSMPGRKGNTIIYGHNKKQVFKSLHQLTGNEVVIIADSKGQEYHYKVSEIKVVTPNETQYLNQTMDDTLTLYTCTGWADSQRLVVVAKNIDEPFKPAFGK